MRLLALDTSTDACSVALGNGDALFERHVVRPKEHTDLLLPMIDEVLAEAALAVGDLDAIVTGIGPGSFIGVRIAVSVAQGLAFAGGLKVVPVSSLAAVAAECFASADASRVVVAQDAHMQEVYLARFERGAGGLPLAVGDAVLQAIGRPADLDGDGSWFAAGAGWRRYPALLASHGPLLGGILDVELPRARFLLPVAVAAWQSGAAVDPLRLEPAYLRLRVAEPADPRTSAPYNRQWNRQ